MKSRDMCGIWFKFEAKTVRRLRLNIWAVIFFYRMSNVLNDRPEVPSRSTSASHPWITSNNKSSWHPFSVTHFCLNGKCWGERYHSFTVRPKQSSYYNWWPKATQTQDFPFRGDFLEQKLFNHLSCAPALLDQNQKKQGPIDLCFILLWCFFGAICLDA